MNKPGKKMLHVVKDNVASQVHLLSFWHIRDKVREELDMPALDQIRRRVYWQVLWETNDRHW